MKNMIKKNMGIVAGVAFFAVTIGTIGAVNAKSNQAAEKEVQVKTAANVEQANGKKAVSNVETANTGSTVPRPVNVQAENLRFDQADIEQLQSLASYDSVALKAKIKDNVQEIKTDLPFFSYPAITVQKGIPVRLIINAEKNNLNSCNNEIVIPDLNLSKKLVPGENVIEFTPTETGVIQYSCWMGMINSTIAVVDDINNIDSADIEGQINALPQVGGCCGIRN